MPITANRIVGKGRAGRRIQGGAKDVDAYRVFEEGQRHPPSIRTPGPMSEKIHRKK